jgi:hypothetical protein
MTQADSVHSTPPTNTSANTPLESTEKPQDSLYLPTDISPEADIATAHLYAVGQPGGAGAVRQAAMKEGTTNSGGLCHKTFRCICSYPVGWLWPLPWGRTINMVGRAV